MGAEQQEQFEADYLAAFHDRPSMGQWLRKLSDGKYADTQTNNNFKVWLQQAKRHEAELAFIKLTKQQIEDRLISCEQSLANAFDECEQIRAKSEAEIAELVSALKSARHKSHCLLLDQFEPESYCSCGIDGLIAKYEVTK